MGAGKQENNRFQRAIEIFRDHGGMMRTADAINESIHPSTLYELRDKGILVRIRRGVYRLNESEPLTKPDVVTVSISISNGVICLISALELHNLTVQIPHAVYVAIPRGAEQPRIEYPPVYVFRFSDDSFTEGAETIQIDNYPVKVYCAEKTIADCFKFRNKIGLDTALDALKMYKERGSMNINMLMYYANICRVENVMRPYVQVLI